MSTLETIPYREGDADFDLAIARPEAPGPHPAVLVCHAFGGRDAFAEDRARRLAELGYLGAAIDLYGIGKRGTDRESSRALMMELIGDPPLLRRRLQAAYERVRAQPGVDPERMGAIGFCFGGLCAILLARMGLPLRAVVSFHGLLKIGESLGETVRARILLEHGADDPMVPPADLATFAEEMQRCRAEWTLHAYPGVVHAFTNPNANDPDFGTIYNADADRRSWQHLTRFFAEHL